MNKKVRDIFPFLQSQNFQKIASIGLLLVILAILPVILFEVKQQQTVNQHAATGQFRPDICGVHFATQDVSPASCHLLTGSSCNVINSSPNQTNGQYAARVAMTSYDGRSHTVQFQLWRYFCTDGGIQPATCSCADIPASDNGVQKSFTVQPGSTTNFDISWSNPAAYAGQSCGQFQFDYIINSIDGNRGCSSGSGFNDPAGFLVCQSGNNCTQSTPTPTPTPGVTITPTNTPVPSDTPTGTPTPTDTPTPGVTITPTGTPTPTATGTVTPTSTPTPTIPNQPTNTPTPTVTSTPKPTLPPTGPGNALVNTGFIGVAIVVIGLAFAIGL